MAGVAHFWIDDGQSFFLVGCGERPTRGVTIHKEIDQTSYSSPWRNYNQGTIVWECETTTLAEKLRYQYANARQASLRELNAVFEQIKADWAMVGPRSMCVMVPTNHVDDKWSLQYLRDWIKGNCEGETCILSSAYKRRVSFSNDGDYMLAMMTFTGMGLIANR